MTFQHQAMAILVGFIWGTNFVFIRYGLDELQPFTFALLRFTFVAIPLVFILPRPNIVWRDLVWYGVLIGFGQFGLMFWAMDENISPGLASLIIQTQVFFTILLAALGFGETIKPKQLVALAICFTGVALIATYTNGQTTLLGIAVTLVASASWACGNIIVKRAGQIDILAFIVWSSLFSIPPLALAALCTEGFNQAAMSIAQLSWEGWGVVVWQSVGNTMIGYGLWNMLFLRYNAAVVTPWALLTPVFGMAASLIMLGETMPWWKLVGAVLILMGLIFNVLASRKRAS